MVKKGHNYVHEDIECPLDLGIEKTKNKEIISKEIEMIHRLFLVIPMYGQASSSQLNESLNLPRCYLAGKEA